MEAPPEGCATDFRVASVGRDKDARARLRETQREDRERRKEEEKEEKEQLRLLAAEDRERHREAAKLAARYPIEDSEVNIRPVINTIVRVCILNLQ